MILGDAANIHLELEVDIEKTTSLKDTFNLMRDYMQMPEGLVNLTKRQKQLLLLVESGLSNENIANRLDISANAVKVHLWRFYKN